MFKKYLKNFSFLKIQSFWNILPEAQITLELYNAQKWNPKKRGIKFEIAYYNILSIPLRVEYILFQLRTHFHLDRIKVFRLCSSNFQFDKVVWRKEIKISNTNDARKWHFQFGSKKTFAYEYYDWTIYW